MAITGGGLLVAPFATCSDREFETGITGPGRILLGFMRALIPLGRDILEKLCKKRMRKDTKKRIGSYVYGHMCATNPGRLCS